MTDFSAGIPRSVLQGYLSRAVTVSCEPDTVLHPERQAHIARFLIDSGARYVCRAACTWDPCGVDIATFPAQKAFLAGVHAKRPEIIFEAAVFECVSAGVRQIPIPAYAFEAFGLPVENRCFDEERMCFADGTYHNQWGEGTYVPDITRPETMLFLYTRACEYLLLGYEGLHMGQVHLMGKNDAGWVCWTRLLDRIREFARQNARRHGVLINAHTHGIKDAHGKLMFHFHMYPSRLVPDMTQPPHSPADGDPQRAFFEVGYSSAIFGKSMGGETYNGWSCDQLPYLVELDNWGPFDTVPLNIPARDGLRCWGYDEISWFANQPAEYRRAWLRYADAWVRACEPGVSFFAMPGQRVAYLYDKDKKLLGNRYFCYDKARFAAGFGDESTICAIWAEHPIGENA